MASKHTMIEEDFKGLVPPLKPLDSKICRMMLVSRMILTPQQQKHVCEGTIANFMESAPAWLAEKDDTSKNWMDLDNKMTETIALVRCLGDKYFLMPDDPAQFEKCENVEKLLFTIMNSMCYLINKICFAPNSPDAAAFDIEYARTRFAKKFASQLPKLEELVTGPFIMGETLPVHADYLLYGCCCDIKSFCPTAFTSSPKILEFLDKFSNYRSPIRRFFRSPDAREGFYVRPSAPHITALLSEDLLQGDLA